MDAQALGWDNHRKFSKVSVMEQTPDGEIRAVERARLEHDDKDAMRVWLSHLDPEMPVALDATFGWPWVADLLEELGHPVHLGHRPDSGGDWRNRAFSDVPALGQLRRIGAG